MKTMRADLLVMGCLALYLVCCDGARVGATTPPTATERSAAVRAEFQRQVPCPSTHMRTGPCPGFIADHKYPLCLGGADTPENMQWQTIADSYVKDRLERAACACRRS